MKYTYLLYIILCFSLLLLLIIPETPITPIINGAKVGIRLDQLVFNHPNL